MLSRYWKAIIAFLSLVSVTIASILSNPDLAAVLPPQVGVWLTLAAVVVGTWLTWAKRNSGNIDDLERMAAENGFQIVRPGTPPTLP